MPRSAAWTAVSGLVTATQSGGCGFCSGLGMTLRGGMEKCFPFQENVSCVHIFGIARRDSSHISFVRSGSQRKPPSSVQVAERPVPNSSRPLEIMSSAAARSAQRAGWLNGGSTTAIPWPSRMRFVRAAAAARNTSGAEQWEYSSRKWCSTAHAWSNPSSSASSTCASALW